MRESFRSIFDQLLSNKIKIISALLMVFEEIDTVVTRIDCALDKHIREDNTAALTARVEALEGKQPEPDVTGEGWRECPKGNVIVWRARYYQTSKRWSVAMCPANWLDTGDLWQPYDPAHPEPPEAPHSGGEA